MPHLLIIDLPGGNDFDILDAALRGGHEFTFLTSDLAHYRRQSEIAARLDQALACMEIPLSDYGATETTVLDWHRRHPVDGVLCLVDIRLVEAAKLAKAIGVRFISPATAALLRDKSSVRARLREHGIRQPDFLAAEDTASLKQAVQDLQPPVLIKPVDGYGSQNIVLLQDLADLDPWISPLDDMLPAQTEYGFGVRGMSKLLVERYLNGPLLGCDTMSVSGRHYLIGVHQKSMFPPPSFAIRGGTFTPRNSDHEPLEGYVRSVLDAVDFECGAAHLEIIMTPEGPHLVEINGRLVGAKIPRLLNCALNTSIHDALIRLHLDELDPRTLQNKTSDVAVSRWLVANTSGTLKRIDLPEHGGLGIRHIDLLARVGDKVSLPFENADRLGMVVALAKTAERAELLADNYVSSIGLTISEDIE